MNRDLMRHRVLKIIVENYQRVKENHGDPDVHEYDYDKLEVPIYDITTQLKISCEQFDQIRSKAIRDKAFKIVENRAHEDCCMIAENTFLYYNEKKYLKESRNFFQKAPFWSSVVLLIIGAAISWMVNYLIDNKREKSRDAKQLILEKRLDSLIQSQKP